MRFRDRKNAFFKLYAFPYQNIFTLIRCFLYIYAILISLLIFLIACEGRIKCMQNNISVMTLCSNLEQKLIESRINDMTTLECYRKVLTEFTVFSGNRSYSQSLGAEFIPTWDKITVHENDDFVKSFYGLGAKGIQTKLCTLHRYYRYIYL